MQDDTKPTNGIHLEVLGEDRDGKRYGDVDIDDVEFPPGLADFPEAPDIEDVREGLAMQAADGALTAAAALRANYRQVLLALPYLVACIGQGFDGGAAGIVVNMPAFLNKFGEINPLTDSLYIPSQWLSAWSAMLYAGQAVGATIAGPATDRFGPKRVTLVASAVMLAAVAIQVASVNRAMLLIGKLFAGVPMGLFVTAANNYISEATTTRLRAPVSSMLMAAISAGLCCGLSTGYARLTYVDNGWGSWKLLLAVQWIFPVVTLITLPLVADSPVYYVKRGNPESARKQLRKIFGTSDSTVVRARLAVIQQNVALEQDFMGQVGTARWKDLIATRSDTLRTLTSCGLWVCYSFGGAAFFGNGLYFLAQQGIPTNEIYGIALGMFGLSTLVGPLSGYLMETLGRRVCFVYGNIVQMGLLLAIGGLGVASGSTGATGGVGWGLSILLNLGITTQSLCTTGPAYTLLNEVSSIRLRAKTQAVSLLTNAVTQCIFNIMTPYLFQAPGNWGAKTGFFFGALSLLVVIWGYFFIPETRKRSSLEIDALYEHDVPPRLFKKTDVSDLAHS